MWICSHIGIKSDGTLWAWGSNGFGALGDGTTVDRYIPVQIGISTNWISISGGAYHTLGIKSDGTLWAWGYNNYGQLGDGTTTQRNAPVQIGSSTYWVSVSSGGQHTLGIKSDRGQFCATGLNNYGQLGDSTLVNKSSFVCNTNTTLPVSLVGFDAVLLGNKEQGLGNSRVLCTWQTASELNNDYFEIERSAVHRPLIGKW